jgi:hypothetical protein
LRHRHHVVAGAVAGEVHHFKLGRRQRRAVAFGTRKQHRHHQLLGLQQRPDIDVEIHRVYPPALLRVGKRFVLAPVVRHALRKRDHPFRGRDFVLKQRFCRVG